MKNYRNFIKMIETDKVIGNREYVIVCIGNSEIMGDSFGPFVGEMLKNDYNVVGDMKNNVNYSNLEFNMRQIKIKYNNPYIIAVDSAVSNVLKVRRDFY